MHNSECFCKDWCRKKDSKHSSTMLTILFSALLMCLLFFFCITTVFTILFFCSSLYNKDTALYVSIFIVYENFKGHYIFFQVKSKSKVIILNDSLSGPEAVSSIGICNILHKQYWIHVPTYVFINLLPFPFASSGRSETSNSNSLPIELTAAIKSALSFSIGVGTIGLPPSGTLRINFPALFNVVLWRFKSLQKKNLVLKILERLEICVIFLGIPSYF